VVEDTDGNTDDRKAGNQDHPACDKDISKKSHHPFPTKPPKPRQRNKDSNPSASASIFSFLAMGIQFSAGRNHATPYFQGKGRGRAGQAPREGKDNGDQENPQDRLAAE
jgi:hypothetical protein